METIDIGYREVTFRVKDAAEILSTPERLEKITPDTYAAMIDFYTYCTQEGFGEDTGFRLWWTPWSRQLEGEFKLVRLLPLQRNGAA